MTNNTVSSVGFATENEKFKQIIINFFVLCYWGQGKWGIQKPLKGVENFHTFYFFY